MMDIDYSNDSSGLYTWAVFKLVKKNTSEMAIFSAIVDLSISY